MIEVVSGIFYDPSKQYLHEQSQEFQQFWEQNSEVTDWEANSKSSRVLERTFINEVISLKINYIYAYPVEHPTWGALIENPKILML